ncbi:MAG: hypothetical protein ACOC8E_07615, partial [Planctomycetota bacterium]
DLAERTDPNWVHEFDAEGHWVLKGSFHCSPGDTEDESTIDKTGQTIVGEEVTTIIHVMKPLTIRRVLPCASTTRRASRGVNTNPLPVRRAGIGHTVRGVVALELRTTTLFLLTAEVAKRGERNIYGLPRGADPRRICPNRGNALRPRLRGLLRDLRVVGGKLLALSC